MNGRAAQGPTVRNCSEIWATDVRKTLDIFYTATGVIAALATVLIAVVVFVQVGGRMLGLGIRGADDVVAWLTASASLAGIGYAFTQKAHVKVELLLDRMQGRARHLVLLLSTSLSLVITAYAAYACVLMVYESYTLGDVSQGDIPVKLWIPQLGVAIGAIALAVAVADALIAVALGQTRERETAKAVLAEV
jgi:TRAP-type C4-dicarboxylate transport system permease small subunit